MYVWILHRSTVTPKNKHLLTLEYDFTAVYLHFPVLVNVLLFLQVKKEACL